MLRLRSVLLSSCALALLGAVPAASQVVESTGIRALGMGGAFVAVANDSSATWWNPAGLATGPFVDASLSGATTETAGGHPATRVGAGSFALVTPALGLSLHRFRVTEVPARSTGAGSVVRQEEGTPVRSLTAWQLGATLVQTVLPGVHAGATVKYVRGAVRRSVVTDRAVADQLDAAHDAGGPAVASGTADLDVGVMATAGPLRAGLLVRNVTQPSLGGVELPRQVRVGAAFDGGAMGGPPMTLAVDADMRVYDSATGPRRVVAVGGEQWLLAHRLGLRAGARVNTTGLRERSVTAGMSVAVRAGMYLEGHVIRGGSRDERGWGVASRVSF